MSAPTTTQIIHAYRNLYRAGLKAVQYSTPARYSIRDKLRFAFRPREFGERQGQSDIFDEAAIGNTIQFLEAAAANKGTEHRIVKNLCSVHHWRYVNLKRRNMQKVLKKVDRQFLPVAYTEYENMIKLLNDSMKLELR